jgi:hypothetical protein
VICEQRQEPDGIEDIRFANSVWTSNARVRREVHREADQIFESINFEPGNQSILLQDARDSHAQNGAPRTL